MKAPLILVPLAVVGLWIASSFRSTSNGSAFDLTSFSRLPVLADGRVKPVDTIARSGLLMLQGRQRLVAPDGHSLEPIEWLLDCTYKPEVADSLKIFRIDNAETLSLFGLSGEGGGVRFSFNELKGGIQDLERQASQADGTEGSSQSAFQRSVVALRDKLQFYTRLKLTLYPTDSYDFVKDLRDRPTLRANQGRLNTIDSYSLFRPIPPAAGADWLNIGRAAMLDLASQSPDPDVLAFAELGNAWRSGDSAAFNRIIAERLKVVGDRLPSSVRRCGIEALLNRLDLFSLSIALYVFAFLAAVSSWLTRGQAAQRLSFQFLAFAFVVASMGIAARMWLEGRPPVTNLYSSALFIGWGAAGICLVLEILNRNGVACAAGGLLGVGTLIIAHHLSLSGDTMQMMRAVLDSNFWLATHVITVTVGYSSTFLAGFLALIYILRGVFTRSLDSGTARSLEKMVYGIVCFATFFSFLGTVLGGIWADQSWGRFWGWDPKENGALIIVIWNAVILHCRWGGLVGRNGLMAMAVVGNVITAWSWFGTNMLGVGLHSYGFTSEAFYGLIVFASSQVGIALLSLLPASRWKSFA